MTRTRQYSQGHRLLLGFMVTLPVAASPIAAETFYGTLVRVLSEDTVPVVDPSKTLH